MDVPLNTLLEQMSTSVLEAQQSIELTGMDLYLSHFDKKGEGEDAVYAPKTLQVQMTGKDARIMEIPLAALMNHNTLGLNQVKVKVNVNLNTRGDDLYVRVGPQTASAEGAADANEVSPSGEIELIFKKEMPSEGISRHNQELQRFV